MAERPIALPSVREQRVDISLHYPLLLAAHRHCAGLAVLAAPAHAVSHAKRAQLAATGGGNAFAGVAPDRSQAKATTLKIADEYDRLAA